MFLFVQLLLFPLMMNLRPWHWRCFLPTKEKNCKIAKDPETNIENQNKTTNTLKSGLRKTKTKTKKKRNRTSYNMFVLVNYRKSSQEHTKTNHTTPYDTTLPYQRQLQSSIDWKHICMLPLPLPLPLPLHVHLSFTFKRLSWL